MAFVRVPWLVLHGRWICSLAAIQLHGEKGSRGMKEWVDIPVQLNVTSIAHSTTAAYSASPPDYSPPHPPSSPN
jgi:hypothetical protein